MATFAETDEALLGAAEIVAKTPTSLAVSGGSRSNLLSLKLSEILSTSYADSSIKDALQLLGDRIEENTPELRRQFKANVEAEVIEANGQVLEQFSKIAMQLERIKRTITNMNTIVGEITERVDKSKAETKDLFVEEEKLSATKGEITAKQSLLDGIRAHFTLNENEVEVMTSSAEPIDDRFFVVIDKAKKIVSDCEVLLACENPVLGVEIMDRMSKYQDQAFDKLYYWIQGEIRHFSVDDERNRQTIRRALGLLAERPELLQNCLDGLSDMRQKVILREFLSALTEGSKPIELAAYDPFRYVGDMLAWTHSETVNEKEILELLFAVHDPKIVIAENETIIEPWIEEFDIARTVSELTDKNMQSICKPLKARIDQALSGNIDFTLAYKIYNLIEFYYSIFCKYLVDGSVLLNLLKVLQASSMNQFHRSVKSQVHSVQIDLPEVLSDLQPPMFLGENLNKMKILMQSFDTSSAVTHEGKEEEFTKIIEEALEPYLLCCLSMCDNGNIGPEDKDMFMINSTDAIIAVLELYPFTKAKVNEYNKQIQEHIKSLVGTEYNIFLRDSTLGPVLKAIIDKAEDISFESIPELQEENIGQLAIALDEFLPSALMDAQTRLQRLGSPRLGNTIIQEAARMFVKDFEKVDNTIIEDLGISRTLFPRTVAEVKVLLVL
ncbi:oligomeric Golgi complex subunit 6, partial [Lipomyces oligophaga]|uniref:oligomeric Golgi complex subunit 6 n=1 Tax=Lipomyces oligophaga TaxID=45792 RepID=UPI0034CFA843